MKHTLTWHIPILTAIVLLTALWAKGEWATLPVFIAGALYGLVAWLWIGHLMASRKAEGGKS